VSRRAALGLTDEQVGEMEQIDQKREEENAAAREEVEEERKQATTGRPAGAGSGGGPAAPQGMRGGGMRGGGMHGGRMGGGIPASGSSGVRKTDRQATLDDRLDENDTKAYLDAENVLTEAQKGRARDIASDYREQLYEQRAMARRKATSSK
jgi:hypothetical protein